MNQPVLRSLSSVTNCILENSLWSSSRRPITVLTYHSIDNEVGPYSITPTTFLRQMECIFENYEVIRLNDIHGIFNKPPDKKRRVVITFDDAFCNFYEYVLPILKDFKFPCTVFVPTGYMGKKNEWDKLNPEILQRTIMSTDKINAISKEEIIDIGSHSVEHLDMYKLNEDKIRIQAVKSKETLEKIIGKPVTSFAYPFGQLDNYSRLSTKILIEAGYNVGVTTHWGSYQLKDNIMCLHRICLGESEIKEDIKAIIEGRDDWIIIKEKLGFVRRSCKRVLSWHKSKLG